MNIRKVMIIIYTAAVSTNVLSMSDSSKEPELVPEPDPFAVRAIESPEQWREESYQRILAEFEKMRIQNPESTNLELGVLVYPPVEMDNLEAYDFLIGLMRDMPEGTSSGFSYLQGFKSISVQLNRAGVDYLHLLGVVNLSLDRLKEAVN